MAMWGGWPGPVDYEKKRLDEIIQEQGKTINNLSMRLKQLEDKLNNSLTISNNLPSTPSLTSPRSPFVKIGDTYIQPVINVNHNTVLYYGLFQKLTEDISINLITKQEQKTSAFPNCTVISNKVNL